jgi:hypothetical protein
MFNKIASKQFKYAFVHKICLLILVIFAFLLVFMDFCQEITVFVGSLKIYTHF